PDAGSAEMICGGDAEVLLEYVDSGDTTLEELFRSLMKLGEKRRSCFLFTRVSIGTGQSGPVEHLVIDDAGVTVGGFSGDEQAVGSMPPKRILKPAQLLDMDSWDYPVFLEWLRPRGTVYIFGAGHVGECVAHLAKYVDFKVVVLDDRDEFASFERVPDADTVLAPDSFQGAVEDLEVDEDSYLVIVTRGHAHDKTVLAQSLRSDAGYIGMIGSRRKTALIYEALIKEGFSREDLERVHAPIGLPIGGETPQEIAVSIVAELIQMRDRKDKLRNL
ncbi:XdhC family protein, partial [Thermodesulfobacteriota bacterium]